MLFTRASEYALIATIFIAKSNKPEGVDNLSVKLNISKSFLAKILQNMAKQGILTSYKGAKGGFTLAKDPTLISILEIVKASDAGSGIVFSCSTGSKCCPNTPAKETVCSIWPLLNRLQDKVDDVLENTKLDDLLEQ